MRSSELEALAPGKPTFQWIEARGMRCGTSPGVAITPGDDPRGELARARGRRARPRVLPARLGRLRGGRRSAASAARIRQLEPALLQPVQPVHVEAAPGVRAAARSYHGALYVIAVNAGHEGEPTSASRCPASADRTLLVLGTPKTVKARGRRFHRHASGRFGRPHLRRAPLS